MNNKLFVGNLSYNVTEEQLSDLFSEHGKVLSASLPREKETGRMRGFGFIEMDSQAAAEAAIKKLDGRELDGRQLKVNISTPKPRVGSRY